MAERITGDYDFSPYPWSQLFDGNTWRIKRGADFTVKPETFKSYVRTEARKRNVNVEVKVEEESGDVVMRAGRPVVRSVVSS